MDQQQRERVQTSPSAGEGSVPADQSYARSYLRPQNEDDDGYDPYSDRPAAREPLFEEDPWR